MNIPNCITIVRILLIPILVIFLLEGRLLTAFWIFVAAGVSDGLDGFLARALKQKTDFGAFVDPIADKLLLITSFVTLAALGMLPKWLAVLVVSRDILIVGGIGVLMLYDRPFDIKPAFVSKITTFLQLLTVVLHLGQEYVTSLFAMRDYLILLTALFTILSGAQYLIRGFTILGNPDLAHRTKKNG
ncbi:CDP-diacylglycerol--glycerol-3-phosphate 3-phosphatidyltransferase [Thiovibrio sp. JS02]